MTKGLQAFDNQLSLPHCRFTKTALAIDDNINRDDWQNIGMFLRTVEGAVQFWIGDWVRFGDRKWGEKYDEAEEVTGQSYQTLRDIKYVAENVDLSRRRDKLPFAHHREVAALEPEKQNFWLDKAEKESLTRNELRYEIRQSKRQHAPPLPENKYNVFYADPPWEYTSGDQHSDSLQHTVIGDHYQSMTIEEICNLQISTLAADDAVLFLWVTSPLLAESFEVIKAWKFEYKTSMVWDKVKHNVGNYVSVRHELLLICTKGQFTPTAVPLKLIDSVQTIERSNRHSEKPDEFAAIIENLYPNQKYIELFARRKRDGWTSWGNEL